MKLYKLAYLAPAWLCNCHTTCSCTDFCFSYIKRITKPDWTFTENQAFAVVGKKYPYALMPFCKINLKFPSIEIVPNHGSFRITGFIVDNDSVIEI